MKQMSEGMMHRSNFKSKLRVQNITPSLDTNVNVSAEFGLMCSRVTGWMLRLLKHRQQLMLLGFSRLHKLWLRLLLNSLICLSCRLIKDRKLQISSGKFSAERGRASSHLSSAPISNCFDVYVTQAAAVVMTLSEMNQRSGKSSLQRVSSTFCQLST